jgi:transcriptional regulator with XRE-family HTH domain
MVNLTDFGVAVRKARLDAKVTLNDMAIELDVTPAFLSGLEVGRKKIPKDWAEKIEAFFKTKGVAVPNLRKLADVANRSIPLDGMTPQKAMMLAAFARTSFSRQQMEKFSKLLGEIKEE